MQHVEMEKRKEQCQLEKCSTFLGCSNNNATSLDVSTLGTLFSILGD